MAKELPYFKFFPSEWVTGDITLCTESAQGLFINVCSYYWMKDCSMSLANAKQRFSKHEASLEELLKHDIIKLDSDENILINFLDKQMNEFIDISSKRAMAGSKGGKANAKQMKVFAKAKSSNKDKDKDKDKEVDKEKEKWRTNFEEYKKIVNDAFDKIVNDPVEMKNQEKFNPNLDIKLSLQKSVHNFWGTEAGWNHKKKSRSKKINMITTLLQNIDKSKVYKSNRPSQTKNNFTPQDAIEQAKWIFEENGLENV